MKRLLFAVCLAMVIAGCTKTEKYLDLAYRDHILSTSGMIFYGEDPDDAGFDDMYYAFAAGADEISKASAAAWKTFKAKIAKMSRKDRAYMRYIYEDIANMAQLAEYSYQDSDVVIPEGWVDRGVQDPRLIEIFQKPALSRLVPMGLKCSLLTNGERNVLVFAGTDFPSNWRDFEQVKHFLVDAYEDIYGALRDDATQAVLAGEIVDNLLAAGYVTKENLEFVGHSLGGRLACEMSVRYGCPAVVFNAAGVSPKTYQEYNESKAAAGEGWRGYIINVVSANDPLTCVQKYMSVSIDPVKAKVLEILSSEKKTVDQYVSLGLDVISSVVDNVYERDYRAIGAVMPVKENLTGHGINELAMSLRARASVCR
jgi:hypothetical protein